MPPSEYLEFTIPDEARFAKLVTAFEALRAAKRSGDFRDTAYWLNFFDETALAHFWWPTPEELEEHHRLWFATPVETRFSDPRFGKRWIFESMIDAFKNGEYALETCAPLFAGRGRLEFMAHSWPFGGTGCMRALIESFGMEVVAESD